MPRTPAELLAEHLHGICKEWPACRCADRRRYWDTHLDQLDELSPAQAEELLLSLACTLSCIIKSCPDRFWRRLAMAEFIHPAFDDIREQMRSKRRWH
jgi:hypothetical protein